jgi:RNA polymerase sigma-70 factor (family 1)
MTAYGKLSDQELTALLKEGNHAAFKELYDRYWVTMINVAHKRLDSIDAAQEVVQDLFVTLFLKRDTLDIRTTLEGYLKTALKRKVLNTYRSLHIHNKYLDTILQDNKVEHATADQSLQTKELSLKVSQATSKMPEKCREVFLLSRVENLSNKSIAEKLGISVSTVEKHISKASKILQKDFQGYQIGVVLLLLDIFTSK